MVKFFSQVIALLYFSVIGFSQVDEIWLDSGFEKNDSVRLHQPLTDDQIKEYVLSRYTDRQAGLIGGQVSSIYHELVDSAVITIEIEGEHIRSIVANHGLFSLSIKQTHKNKLLDVTITHPDFHSYDTSLVFAGSDPVVLSVEMTPRYKILLRGRVFAGNVPLEGAGVEIKHDGKTYNLITRGCFYDDEDYWNCLFDGMFKLELTANDSSDSIYLTINKEGMKQLNTGMIFKEYKGEIMQLKMKYTSKLPVIPVNNLNLKLAFPFTSLDNDWYVNLTYYRLLNKTNLKRFAIGIDGNMYVSTISVSHNTLNGLDPVSSDSSYITGFIGPSVLFWLISPDRRKFSTYVGCTFSVQLNKPQLVFQPFIGTRFFVDINKALSLEIRYASYDRDIVHYNFNYYGNAERYTVSKHFDIIHLNLGVQVVF
ncbi:hypothetical protein ES705_44910 [subsurface metagenome]